MAQEIKLPTVRNDATNKPFKRPIEKKPIEKRAPEKKILEKKVPIAEEKPIEPIKPVSIPKCPQCRSVNVSKRVDGIKCKRCGFFRWEQVV